MTGKRNRRVRLVPKEVADIEPIIRGGRQTRLQHIEEVAFGPQDSETGAASTEAAIEAIVRSLERDGELTRRSLWTS